MRATWMLYLYMERCISVIRLQIDQIGNSSEKSAQFHSTISTGISERVPHWTHHYATPSTVHIKHVVPASSQHHTNDAHLFHPPWSHDWWSNMRLTSTIVVIRSSKAQSVNAVYHRLVRGNARSLSNPSHEIIFSNCQQIHNMKLGCSSKTWPLVKSVATFAWKPTSWLPNTINKIASMFLAACMSCFILQLTLLDSQALQPSIQLLLRLGVPRTVCLWRRAARVHWRVQTPWWARDTWMALSTSVQCTQTREWWHNSSTWVRGASIHADEVFARVASGYARLL